MNSRQFPPPTVGMILAELRHAVDNGGANGARCNQWANDLERALSHAAAVGGEPFLWLRMKPDGTPDWAEDCVGQDASFLDRELEADGYTLLPLYTATPPAPAAVAGGDAEEDAYVIDALAHLLAEISIIVNGPEPAGTKWSYHDLPAKVRALAAQPAAGGGLAELVEAMELPEGYTVVEELPGVWTYSHMQGEQRMVCSASWNHPALAACAAWNDTAAQRPGARDDTARLDWLDAQNMPMQIGWDVRKAPAGNVIVQSVVFLGGAEPRSIRQAIDAAIAIPQPASGEAS